MLKKEQMNKEWKTHIHQIWQTVGKMLNSVLEMTVINTGRQMVPGCERVETVLLELPFFF